ncbi:hypothetical protein AC578_6057 [Pseudocercospora eumusae]|uniref:Trafficking protein particle complex II-specific subunit 65 IgD3 domain-containing protein n=1 Tax=Pseudocercospora eumusae TaxID=321146 RepID=A0A139HVV8_9PEZI|nr:hypothetical protein AC578_6057 [Pseudocercospora eumusae]
MDVKARFEGLSRSACLDVLLPKAPQFDAAAWIRDGAADELFRAPARRNLFFDEQASIIVLLKTPRTEDEVCGTLAHLELVIAAHATDAVPQGSGNTASASGKHDLNSVTIQASDFADIVALGDQTFVIWNPRLHLSRPRTRLQRPAIYFTANLTIGSSGQKAPSGPTDPYLPSCEPLPANVLEPLRFDPALRSSDVFLSEARITKVAPKAPNLADVVRPIRGATKRAFPAVPALFTRIRYSTLPDAIVASLHLETSPVIAGTVRITKAELDIPHAKVEDLTNVSLPLETRGGDETIFLFKLLSLDNTRPAADNQSPVSISIRASASLDQGSETSFEIDWQAHVDLSHTWQKPSYRWSKPLSTSSHHKSLSVQSLPKSSLDAGRRTSNEGTNEGVTFNFTGPPVVPASTEFKLSVHCNNRSNRPRRFGLVMIQPKKSRAVMSSITNTSADTDMIANIFRAPPLEKSKLPDVLDLNPDVRIGPLPPGACFETHMTYKALKSGVLDLGTLRIVDLDSRQTVDVRELPDVIAMAIES